MTCQAQGRRSGFQSLCPCRQGATDAGCGPGADHAVPPWPGWVFGQRVLMLEHTGRRSGQARFVCLEVVERPGPDRVVIVSGFGERAEWYRNLLTDPSCFVSTGRLRRVPARARFGRSPSCSFPWPPALPCSTTPCVATPATSRWPAGTASSTRRGYRMSLADSCGRTHRDRPGIPGSIPVCSPKPAAAGNIASAVAAGVMTAQAGRSSVWTGPRQAWMRKLPACRVQVVRRSRGAYERRSGAG